MSESRDSITDNVMPSIQLWLLSKGRGYRRSMGDFVKDFASEMRQQCNVPVERIFLGTAVIHPQAYAWYHLWESSSPDAVLEGFLTKEQFEKRNERYGKGAPIIQLEHKEAVRIRASDKDMAGSSKELFEEKGYTDLYGRRITIYDQFGGGITYCTRRQDGFTEEHIAFFDTLHPALSCVVQLIMKDICMHTLLCIYLGKGPGGQVYQGSIRRGDGRTVRSCVWFSDVRGFTQMSSELGRDTVISIINDVFERSEKAITCNGGEVLKYMGDGLMAVFTPEHVTFSKENPKASHRERKASTSDVTDSDKAEICQSARKAAVELQVALAEMRQERAANDLPGSDVRVGIGLHYGDVSYGNIGSPGRLDLTVIGPSVNLASRVEGLCGKLGAPVLATEDFVKRDVDTSMWQSRGTHSVKGVAEPVEVYELPLEEIS